MIELKALQAQVKTLVEDLRGQVAEAPGLRAELRQEYAQAQAAQRVGGSFETWLDDVLDQAAVAWVLGCVFVRFCEDNELVEKLWIGGADPAAPAERAVQHRQAYLIANPGTTTGTGCGRRSATCAASRPPARSSTSTTRPGGSTSPARPRRS
nr:hypothetical protein [Micromonospora sp. U56]